MKYAPTIETYNPEGPLWIGDKPLMDSGLLKAGESVERGQLVELTGGLFVEATGADVTAVYGISSETYTAGATNETIVVYTSGTFTKDLIKYPAGKTYADYKVALRNKGIVLR